MEKGNVPIVLSSHESELKPFEKLYEKDRSHARVFAIQKKVLLSRTLLYDNGPKAFKILVEIKSYGVSCTLKRFVRRKISKLISVNNTKFYIKSSDEKTLLRPLKPNDLNTKEKEIFYMKFPHLRFMEEENIQLAFNTVVRLKLFTLKKVIAHVYKCQYTEQVKQLWDDTFHFCRPKKQFQLALKTITNIHRANLELFKNIDYLMDCCRMADSLNKKIDASWTYRRLQEEHDSMSMIVTEIIAGADDRSLHIDEMYLEFSAFIDYIFPDAIIPTTRKLTEEGLKQHHCVATYASQIDNGSCAIFHIQGFTLQVRKNRVYTDQGDIIAYGLQMGQFLGYRNQSAPEYLKVQINSLISQFNTLKQQNGKEINEGQIGLTHLDRNQVVIGQEELNQAREAYNRLERHGQQEHNYAPNPGELPW